MVRVSVSRWGLAVVMAAAMVSGCQCDNQGECSDVTTVVFEDPIDGATVTSPFDVHLTARNGDGGATAKLDSATLTVDNGQPLTGTVSDATATFSQLQLNAGPHTLTAQVNRGTCGKTSTINITVKAEGCTMPAVTALAFPQDTSNDGILNAAELPAGTNLQVQVTADCTTGVQVQIKHNGTVVGGPADFSNGMATVTLPTLPDSDSATYDLTAELVQSGSPVGTGLGASIRVERALPACENTTELVQGPRNGGTGTEHLLAASGTTAAPAAEFRLDGAQAMTSTPSMGAVSASWSVPKSGDTTYAVELRCTDNFGNVTTDTKMVRVDYVAPAVMITQPATNPDGGSTAVTDSPAAVTVTTNAEDGSRACGFLVSGTTRTPFGSCPAVSGGIANLEAPIPLDGLYTIEVEVTDLAGNTAAASVAIDAVLAGCGLAFTRPSACPALITAGQVNNGLYNFQTQSNVSCVGQPCGITLDPVSPDGGIGAPIPVGMGTLDAAGRCTISWAVDGGTYLALAEVANLNDGGTDTASCDITVDLTGPAIQSPVVPSGQPYAVINIAQDTQPGTEGAQRLLQFSASVPAGGRVDVCTTQAVDPYTMRARATSAECGSGWYVLASGVVSPTSGFTFPEGEYSIKVVVVANGVTSSSAPVPVLVDVTPPCVVRQASPWPQDTAGGMADGRLNIAELGTNAPRLQFALGCGDMDPSTLSATSPVVVRELVNGNPTGAFNLSTNATFASALYSVDLTQSVANERDYVFFVELTDRAGNKNTYSGMASDPARYDMRIDKVAPSCSIVAPSASDALLGIAQVPGGQFTVTVATAGDVSTNGVSVSLGGPTPLMRSLTPVAPANQATTVFALTGTADWTVDSTCTDIAGNATAATQRALRIDLDRPTCHINTPTNTMAYGTNQIPTSVMVGGVSDGRIVTCSTNGTTLTPSLTVASGTAAGTLTYPNGTQTVSCTVVDGAGNDCTDTVVGVVVNSTACGLALTSPQQTASGFWHNRTNTSNLTATTGTANVTAHTVDCGQGKTVTLQRTAPTAGTPTTAMTDSSGNVSFPGVAVADGETWTVSIDNGAGVTTPQTFQVGLVAPSATGVTIGGAAVTTGANLTFVASSGNRNIELATANYFADTNPGTAGAQFDLGVTGVNGAIKAGIDGTVELVFKGAVLTSQSVTTANQSFSFTGTTLPHNDSGAFEVRIRDTAGNSTSAINNPTAIDVIAPAAPTVTQNLTSARGAQVTLQWAPTYDDGTTAASGGHAGYDVRWTTGAVPANNAMATSADYFGSSSYQDTLSAWSTSTITRLLDLPPLNTYYIAVRAKDEVGNYSTFAAPAALTNNWTQVTLSAPVAGATFGQSVATSASLNGDAISDVVVSAPTKTGGGAVYVYYGASSFGSQATCGAGCQELNPSDTATGQFGSDIGTGGNLGDVASEGKPDLVVAQLWTAAAPNNGGRVVIFFGTTGTTIATATSIELRGDSTNRIGQTARIIKDIDGDGLDELAIAAPFFSANQGRVFIYRGRTQAQWAAARTATDPTTMVPYIPVSAATANYVIDGPSPLLVSPAGNAFGQNRWGLVSVGDINADLINDVAIPMSRATINRYRIFSGAALAASTGGSPASAANYLLELSTATTTDNAVTNGLGASSIGGRDVVDSVANDLVTSFAGAPGGGKVFVYSAPVAMGTGQPSPVATVTGPLTFGYQVSVGQLNTGDARADLVVGQGLTASNVSWVVYQQATSRFDGSGASEVLGTTPAFWVSRFDGATLLGSTNTSLGKSNAVADVDGNGQQDVILSDDRAGSILIWR